MTSTRTDRSREPATIGLSSQSIQFHQNTPWSPEERKLPRHGHPAINSRSQKALSLAVPPPRLGAAPIAQTLPHKGRRPGPGVVAGPDPPPEWPSFRGAGQGDPSGAEGKAGLSLHRKGHLRATPLRRSDATNGGAPGVTRTPGTQFRKLLLYPPELRGHTELRDGQPRFYHHVLTMC